MTAEPTTYFKLAQGEEQSLALDQTADGHEALRLQAKKLAQKQIYPAQPANSPWEKDPVGTEPPLGQSIDAVPDVSKVDR